MGRGGDEGIWEGREDEWDRANERYDRCVALVQNGSLRSILGGDTIDKLVGIMFSPGRKNSSESFLWACDHRSSKRTRKLCAKKVVEEVFDRWRDLDETVF